MTEDLTIYIQFLMREPQNVSLKWTGPGFYIRIYSNEGYATHQEQTRMTVAGSMKIGEAIGPGCASLMRQCMAEARSSLEVQLEVSRNTIVKQQENVARIEEILSQMGELVEAGNGEQGGVVEAG
jgi:hypothetical protein